MLQETTALPQGRGRIDPQSSQKLADMTISRRLVNYKDTGRLPGPNQGRLAVDRLSQGTVAKRVETDMSSVSQCDLDGPWLYCKERHVVS